MTASDKLKQRRIIIGVKIIKSRLEIAKRTLEHIANCSDCNGDLCQNSAKLALVEMKQIGKRKNK